MKRLLPLILRWASWFRFGFFKVKTFCIWSPVATGGSRAKSELIVKSKCTWDCSDMSEEESEVSITLGSALHALPDTTESQGEELEAHECWEPSETESWVFIWNGHAQRRAHGHTSHCRKQRTPLQIREQCDGTGQREASESTNTLPDDVDSGDSDSCCLASLILLSAAMLGQSSGSTLSE